MKKYNAFALELIALNRSYSNKIATFTFCYSNCPGNANQ